MMFRRKDGKAIANFSLPSAATCFLTTNDGKRLVVGGRDGTVVTLVVAAIDEEDAGNQEVLMSMAKHLKSLPSRRTRDRRQESFAESEFSSNTYEERITVEKRLKIRRRFRYFATVFSASFTINISCAVAGLSLEWPCCWTR